MSTDEHPYFSDESFKRLFDNYKNRLYGYVLAIARSPYTAEEITQEIFIKLWLCRDVLHKVDNLDGYIFTMARNGTQGLSGKRAPGTTSCGGPRWAKSQRIRGFKN